MPLPSSLLLAPRWLAIAAFAAYGVYRRSLTTWILVGLNIVGIQEAAKLNIFLAVLDFAIKAGEPTVPHEEVVRWLDTWGTPAYRPWADR